jgi:predicted dehydrogenase
MSMLKFNYEYDRRLRWAHVGCGEHSYRNVLPAFRYCPIELETVCDLKPGLAAEFARIFGAKRSCAGYEDVLADDSTEVVSLVMGVDADSLIVYPEMAIRALEAGKHVWIEKPPANTVAEVRRIREAERATGKRVFCGLKKMFFPAIMRAATIIGTEPFGQAVQFTGRYPQNMPTRDQMAGDPASLIGFCDHLCHPTSIALRLMGKIHEFMYIREVTHGGAMVSMRFASGAIGNLHLCPGMGRTGPMERTEVVGSKGGHLVIDNNIDLHWYRHGEGKHYGRDPDFTGDPDKAALHWQPEFSLGVLYNTGPFLLGYATELLHFAEAILDDKPFDCAGTDDMLHLTAIYEAFLATPEGEWVTVGA